MLDRSSKIYDKRYTEDRFQCEQLEERLNEMLKLNALKL